MVQQNSRETYPRSKVVVHKLIPGSESELTITSILIEYYSGIIFRNSIDQKDYLTAIHSQLRGFQIPIVGYFFTASERYIIQID